MMFGVLSFPRSPSTMSEKSCEISQTRKSIPAVNDAPILISNTPKKFRVPEAIDNE